RGQTGCVTFGAFTTGAYERSNSRCSKPQAGSPKGRADTSTEPLGCRSHINMNIHPIFQNRTAAGQALAPELQFVGTDEHPLVLARPRGGVPVGFEIARLLHADLDIILVRKLGVPDLEELAMGAIAGGGVRVLNKALIEQLAIPAETVETVAAKEQAEIERR